MIIGIDSEMGSGSHRDWNCFPSLLGERKNLVTSVYSLSFAFWLPDTGETRGAETIWLH